jgi:CheY-like chemotaxis protein
MTAAEPRLILVVEDHAPDRLVLEQLLSRFDYDCLLVSSGEDALLELEKNPFTAVIMDIKLPQMDGLECARQIRKIEGRGNHGVPIIAVTARVGSDDRMACLKAGMNDYISKPFEPEELRRVLLRWAYRPDKPNLKLLRSEPNS